MNKLLTELFANFTVPQAKKILLSKDVTPAIRDQVYDLAKKLGKSDEIVNQSLAVYARKGDVKKVQELIKQVVEVDGVKPHTDFQCVLAQTHAVKGDIPESLKILNSIPDSSIDPFTFPALVSKLGDYPDGLQWCLRVFNKVKKQSSNNKPYNSLVNKVGKNGDLKKMEEMFGDMVKKGLKVDGYTFGCMIDAFVKNNNMDKAVEWLEESKRRGIIPTPASYETIMGGYVKMGDMEGAARWRNTMEKAEFTLNIQTRSMIKQGKLNEVLSLVEDAVSKGKRRNVVPYYPMLIGGFVRSKSMDSALKLKHFMEDKGLHGNVNTYNTIISGYCNIGDMERALEMLAEMERKNITPNAITFTTIITGYCKKGDIEQAQHTLHMMERRNLRPTVATCTSLIDGHIKKGDMEHALHVLHMMEKQNIRPNEATFCMLIGGYCKQRKMIKALEMKEEMARRGFQPNVPMLQALRTGCYSVGDVGKAELISSEIKRLENRK